MISWQMEGFIQRHISFGAGTSNRRLRLTILCIYHSRDKLDKPVSYKVLSYIIHINFLSMQKGVIHCNQTAV